MRLSGGETMCMIFVNLWEVRTKDRGGSHTASLSTHGMRSASD